MMANFLVMGSQLGVAASRKQAKLEYTEIGSGDTVGWMDIPNSSGHWAAFVMPIGRNSGKLAYGASYAYRVWNDSDVSNGILSLHSPTRQIIFLLPLSETCKIHCVVKHASLWKIYAIVIPIPTSTCLPAILWNVR